MKGIAAGSGDCEGAGQFLPGVIRSGKHKEVYDRCTVGWAD